MKYNEVLEHFEAYFGPQKKNITLALDFSCTDRNLAKYLTK